MLGKCINLGPFISVDESSAKDIKPKSWISNISVRSMFDAGTVFYLSFFSFANKGLDVANHVRAAVITTPVKSASSAIKKASAQVACYFGVHSCLIG